MSHKLTEIIRYRLQHQDEIADLPLAVALRDLVSKTVSHQRPKQNGKES